MGSTRQPARLVMELDAVDRTHLELVGGKGANLGELARLDGVAVPAGFCVTTEAFAAVVGTDPSVTARLDRLAGLTAHDSAEIAALSTEMRRDIRRAAIPDDIATEITAAVTHHGETAAYAVRSSATAEDLPTASFAGQHDSFLNVAGAAAILDHVAACWASLFTDRAIAYRIRNGIDHRRVLMAVVVQRQVVTAASGVVFTADPVTSNRTITVIEATLGLGEALVAGRVDPDIYRVRNDEIVERAIAAVSPERGTRPALTDPHVEELAHIARRIEAHFGSPQDIEWCLTGEDDFRIVQARPITTLFPIPPAEDDTNRVYVSVGHNQMMTDAIKPLGLSVWQMTTPAPMAEAGGRLFVDVTARLAAPSSRDDFLELSGKTDPLVRDALQTVLARGDFIPPPPDDAPPPPPTVGATDMLDPDPAVVAELIEESEASIAACRRDIADKTGAELFDFILSDMQELRRLLFNPRGRRVFMTAIEATWWLNQHMFDWLGESNVADILTQSVPHNVTSAMGLALLDVAEVIRAHPAVVACLHEVDDDGFLEELDGLEGGPEVRAAVAAYLVEYGMRCPGEIDITRPRWGERPSDLLPLLLAHVANQAPGEASRRFEQGRLQALAKEEELLGRLRALPDGERKAAETKQMIDRVRTFIGYREYPKYGMVARYFIYKQGLLAEAARLVAGGVLSDPEDIYFLRFDELHGAVRTRRVDVGLIEQRREAFRSYQALTPPRVLTSEGEALTGAFRRDDLPPGALPGLAVSAGSVAGRARVVLDIAGADLEPGDILVTTYTDPSWTPVFVAIAGLVTEVGGTMTHGAVVAREYGLPAVVGVGHAVTSIRDGQRIRVDGTAGYVEILDP